MDISIYVSSDTKYSLSTDSGSELDLKLNSMSVSELDSYLRLHHNEIDTNDDDFELFTF